jgi:hypothetical protein
MQLTQKEKELLANTLKDRYDQSHKYNVGDMELGSTVIVRCAEKVDGVEDVAHAILVVFRQNRKDTLLASIDFDTVDPSYRLKHEEQVAPLVIIRG